ncbi:MAG: nicotinate (nicotinamide) nucleotide adenylyltransferase [Epsilonproteobacteria bacterium]|nr:nicotinate (nicotinamide) nucleotide adenylyltransferase [Campylobacterota bacterium]
MSNLSYAIFGGSFDPPHLGHKEIIKESLKIADKIIVVPTFLNPFKKSFKIPPQKRLELVKKSLADMNNIIISDFEIKNNRPTYTIETFEELSKNYNIKYIIIGADNLKDITKWKDFNTLNSKITWLVAKRANQNLDCSPLKCYNILDINMDISSTEIREGKKLEYIDKKIRDEVINEYKLRK